MLVHVHNTAPTTTLVSIASMRCTPHGRVLTFVLACAARCGDTVRTGRPDDKRSNKRFAATFRGHATHGLDLSDICAGNVTSSAEAADNVTKSARPRSRRVSRVGPRD